MVKWVKGTAIWRGAELGLSIYKLSLDFVMNDFPRPKFFSCLKVYIPQRALEERESGSFIHHYTPSIQRGVGIFPFNSVPVPKSDFYRRKAVELIIHAA